MKLTHTYRENIYLKLQLMIMNNIITSIKIPFTFNGKITYVFDFSI